MNKLLLNILFCFSYEETGAYSYEQMLSFEYYKDTTDINMNNAF